MRSFCRSWRKFSANVAACILRCRLFSKSRWRASRIKTASCVFSRKSMRSCKMPCLVIRKSLRICRKKTDRWRLQKRKERQKRRKKRKQNRKRKMTERARKKSRNKQQICQKAEKISREKEDSVPDFPEETDLAACVARTIRMCFTDVTLKVNLWRSSRSRERWVK